MNIEDLKEYLRILIKKILQIVKKKIPSSSIDTKNLPSYSELENLLSKFQVKNLVNVDSHSFKKRINEFLNLIDYKMENFNNPERQRDLSIKFHWGHDHDFGEFKLKGRLGENHIIKIAIFKDIFKAIPESFIGMKVLDIGCWTGGTSLLLSAMGAAVVAIEEVKKYTESLNYLKYAFDIKNLEPKNLSLYDCTISDFQNKFDLILFAGVLYHLSDPIIALRILFNCLKIGGKILLESAITDSNRSILKYEGPTKLHSGDRKDLSRGGWNWFIPSPITIYQMMIDVGFVDVKLLKINNRCFAVGMKNSHVDMMRSGLSTKIR